MINFTLDGYRFSLARYFLLKGEPPPEKKKWKIVCLCNILNKDENIKDKIVVLKRHKNLRSLIYIDENPYIINEIGQSEKNESFLCDCRAILTPLEEEFEGELEFYV